MPEFLLSQSWNLVKERDGIKVYTRPEPGTSFKSFKGETEFLADAEKVMDLIGNVKNFDWWDDNISEIKVLDYEEGKFMKYYLVYSVPWPLYDRDLCVEANIYINPKTGAKEVMATPLREEIPEYPNRVRIKNYWQKWTILLLQDGMIRLTVEGFVDPGGIVPSWIYNMVITETPLKVIRDVRKHAE
ncbi:MAG: hypothetical protein K0B37_08135 [Bacteroidales bacterium]|nr:hypothetical protein [Bacteroidales bacterium]